MYVLTHTHTFTYSPSLSLLHSYTHMNVCRCVASSNAMCAKRRQRWWSAWRAWSNTARRVWKPATRRSARCLRSHFLHLCGVHFKVVRCGYTHVSRNLPPRRSTQCLRSHFLLRCGVCWTSVVMDICFLYGIVDVCLIESATPRSLWIYLCKECFVYCAEFHTQSVVDISAHRHIAYLRSRVWTRWLAYVAFKVLHPISVY